MHNNIYYNLRKTDCEELLRYPILAQQLSQPNLLKNHTKRELNSLDANSTHF